MDSIIVEIPKRIRDGMLHLRKIFRKQRGFEHIVRYIIGLIVSSNKTLQGIHDIQVYENNKKSSRRSMHESVFEAGWNSDELMKEHRKSVSKDHKGKGQEVIALDWTLIHHDKGPNVYGATKGYDYVNNRMGRFQRVVTAVISNKSYIDGIDLVVQKPGYLEKEKAYLGSTRKNVYDTKKDCFNRISELLHYKKHVMEYKKLTEIASESVKKIEKEKNFSEANYAFDNGVLTVDLTRHIENCNKHWVSELEKSRNINIGGNWKRLDEFERELKESHPESFRPLQVVLRNGEKKQFWAFTIALFICM